MSPATRDLLVLFRALVAERQVLEAFGPSVIATPFTWQAAWLRQRWTQ